MSRRARPGGPLAGLAVAAACLTMSGLAIEAQQPQPSFTTSSDLVVVPALVLDRKRALVRGLSADALGTVPLFARRPRRFLSKILRHRRRAVEVSADKGKVTFANRKLADSVLRPIFI